MKLFAISGQAGFCGEIIINLTVAYEQFAVNFTLAQAGRYDLPPNFLAKLLEINTLFLQLVAELIKG